MGGRATQNEGHSTPKITSEQKKQKLAMDMWALLDKSRQAGGAVLFLAWPRPGRLGRCENKKKSPQIRGRQQLLQA